MAKCTGRKLRREWFGVLSRSPVRKYGLLRVAKVEKIKVPQIKMDAEVLIVELSRLEKIR
jgi:hypothetical protein